MEFLPPPSPLPEAPLGPAPKILLWLVAIGSFLVLAILTGFIILRGRDRAAGNALGLHILAAKEDLLSGGDLAEAITRCYRRMGETLARERNLGRGASMTVGEYERLLAAEGFPEAPLRGLTGLFETVRYGRRGATEAEQRLALECLDDILAFAGPARKASS